MSFNSYDLHEARISDRHSFMEGMQHILLYFLRLYAVSLNLLSYRELHKNKGKEGHTYVAV